MVHGEGLLTWTNSLTEATTGKIRRAIEFQSWTILSQVEFKKLTTLIITAVRDEARAICSFDLMPEGMSEHHGVQFVPGQVAVLSVASEVPAYFAFAGAPEDRELEVLVKRKVGASDVLFDMLRGEKIELLEVAGHGFDLEAQQGKDLVFVAMGTGVAPLRSALRHVLKRKNDFGELVVLYGARTPDDFCYRDETEGWKDAGVELRQVISKPDGHRLVRAHGLRAIVVGPCLARTEISGGLNLRLVGDDGTDARPAREDGFPGR